MATPIQQPVPNSSESSSVHRNTNVEVNENISVNNSSNSDLFEATENTNNERTDSCDPVNVVDGDNNDTYRNNIDIHFGQASDDDDQHRFIPSCENCKICCTLPFRLSSKDDESEGILWDDASPWDWDGGLYDLVCHMNGREQYPKLPDEIAKITVEATTKHLAQLKNELMQAGLQRQYYQNYCGESIAASRIIAPFDFSELELGQILGTGGFNSVSEIIQVRPSQHSRSISVQQQQRERKVYSALEERSRQYIANNVLCTTGTSTAKNHSKSSKDSFDLKKNEKFHSRSTAGQFCTQYVVKHLRNRLVTRTPEKFKRAAIDLIVEGQLLLMMDHPNIVALHGWCGDGPKAFASGDPRGFFLILDKLPVPLEERMTEWRNKLMKCQRQLKRNTTYQQRSQVVTKWARKTLRRNNTNETTKAMLPSKHTIEIQNLFLERITVAYKIGCAIQYMHTKRIMHRDLKVANVGFDIYGEVKLFDFGLSRLLPSSSDETTSTISDMYFMSRVGTKFYMAPEVRRKEAYGLPADVYSFGVLVWELLTLATPREFYHHERDRVSKVHREASTESGMSTSGHNQKNLHSTTRQKQKHDVGTMNDNDNSNQNIRNGWLPLCPCWPVDIKNMIASTMSNDPLDRPTIGQILVLLQNHIDALYKTCGNENNDCTLSDLSLQSDNLITKKKPPTSSSRQNQRVDLTSVDLRMLDKVHATTTKKR